jgi:hypothetical protein
MTSLLAKQDLGISKLVHIDYLTAYTSAAIIFRCTALHGDWH